MRRRQAEIDQTPIGLGRDRDRGRPQRLGSRPERASLVSFPGRRKGFEGIGFAATSRQTGFVRNSLNRNPQGLKLIANLLVGHTAILALAIIMPNNSLSPNLCR